MKTLKPYLLVFVIFLFFFWDWIAYGVPLNKVIIGLCVISILLLIFMNYLETSRNKRALYWKEIKRISRRKFIIKFALLLGLPMSLILSALIFEKAQIIPLILFLIIPVTFMGGFIGYHEWNKCYSEFVNIKHSNTGRDLQDKAYPPSTER